MKLLRLRKAAFDDVSEGAPELCGGVDKSQGDLRAGRLVIGIDELLHGLLEGSSIATKAIHLAVDVFELTGDDVQLEDVKLRIPQHQLLLPVVGTVPLKLQRGDLCAQSLGLFFELLAFLQLFVECCLDAPKVLGLLAELRHQGLRPGGGLRHACQRRLQPVFQAFCVAALLRKLHAEHGSLLPGCVALGLEPPPDLLGRKSLSCSGLRLLGRNLPCPHGRLQLSLERGLRFLRLGLRAPRPALALKRARTLSLRGFARLVRTRGPREGGEQLLGELGGGRLELRLHGPSRVLGLANPFVRGPLLLLVHHVCRGELRNALAAAPQDMPPDPQRVVTQRAAPERPRLRPIHEDEAGDKRRVAVQRVYLLHVAGIHADFLRLAAHPDMLTNRTECPHRLVQSDLANALPRRPADGPLLHPAVVSGGPHTPPGYDKFVTP
mmetsp:Transcript_109876/g.342474  ORF Transcript_109876/g.342474 Transcript_109876/m.342474 type:complete len:437 (+) Transcript_109876:337-1647(+)